MRQNPFEELVQNLKNETSQKSNASLNDWVRYIELEKIHRTILAQDDQIIKNFYKEIRKASISYYNERLKTEIMEKPMKKMFRKDMKTYHFSIEFFLQEIQKQPEIFLTMARKEPEVLEMEGFESVLVTTFYEDFAIDTDYDYKLIKLIEGLMEIQIRNILAPSDLLKERSFLYRILTAYFRRPEYKHYLRTLYTQIAVAEYEDPKKSQKRTFGSILKSWIKTKKIEPIEESLKGLVNIQKKSSNYNEVDDRLIFCFNNAERLLELLFSSMSSAPFSLRVICKMCFEQLSNKFPELNDSDIYKIIMKHLFYPLMIQVPINEMIKKLTGLYLENAIILSRIMKILFHNFSINLFHPLGVICSRLKITLERYMTKLMTVDLDMFSNEKMLEEAKTNTCVYMSFHNLMQLAKAVKAYAKEIKENKKITNTFKILDIAELLNLNFDDIKRETVEKDFSEENVYFSCIFLDEHANNMLDIKLSTEIKSRKYKYEELNLVETILATKLFLLANPVNPYAYPTLEDWLLDLLNDPAINIYDVKECFLRIRAKEILIRLDSLDLYWKEDNFKKLYDKMLDTLLEQAKDFDNKAWKMRVTLEKVLTKLRGRISSLKKSREFMMMLEGNLEMTDMSMRISNMSTMA